MKRKLLISSIILIAMIVIGQASYAAVEIVPSKDGKGTDAIVSTTVSNSFLLCRGMKDTGGSLKGTTVDPHLATNKDWGAVSYLSNSIYGTNTAGQNNGVEVTIDGVKYYSTTTNITGVMNWGANPNVTRYTQTSGLIKAYVDNNSTSTVNENVVELYNNKDSRHVDIINTTSFTANNTLGMALAETQKIYSGIWNVSGTMEYAPVSIRQGIFGFGAGSNLVAYTYYCGTGAAYSDTTFRPVIWNN